MELIDRITAIDKQKSNKAENGYLKWIEDHINDDMWNEDQLVEHFVQEAAITILLYKEAKAKLKQWHEVLVGRNCQVAYTFWKQKLSSKAIN